MGTWGRKLWVSIDGVSLLFDGGAGLQVAAAVAESKKGFESAQQEYDEESLASQARAQ